MTASSGDSTITSSRPESTTYRASSASLWRNSHAWAGTCRGSQRLASSTRMACGSPANIGASPSESGRTVRVTGNMILSAPQAERKRMRAWAWLGARRELSRR